MCSPIPTHFSYLFHTGCVSCHLVTCPYTGNFLRTLPSSPRAAHHSSLLNKYIKGGWCQPKEQLFSPCYNCFMIEDRGSKNLSSPARTHGFWATWGDIWSGSWPPRKLDTWQASWWGVLSCCFLTMSWVSSTPRAPSFKVRSWRKGCDAANIPSICHGYWEGPKCCAVSKFHPSSSSQPGTLVSV